MGQGPSVDDPHAIESSMVVPELVPAQRTALLARFFPTDTREAREACVLVLMWLKRAHFATYHTLRRRLVEPALAHAIPLADLDRQLPFTLNNPFYLRAIALELLRQPERYWEDGRLVRFTELYGRAVAAVEPLRATTRTLRTWEAMRTQLAVVDHQLTEQPPDLVPALHAVWLQANDLYASDAVLPEFAASPVRELFVFLVGLASTQRRPERSAEIFRALATCTAPVDPTLLEQDDSGELRDALAQRFGIDTSLSLDRTHAADVGSVRAVSFLLDMGGTLERCKERQLVYSMCNGRQELVCVTVVGVRRQS